MLYVLQLSQVCSVMYREIESGCWKYSRSELPPMPSVKKPSTKKRPFIIIETDDDVRTGVRALRRKCPILRHAHDLAGDPPLRRRPPGFEGLARIIVGQQLSIASAAAIWGRFEEALRPLDAAKVLAAHGGHHPELAQVRRLVAAVRADLEPHLLKEERILFPAIHELAAGRTEFPFGTVANPIRMMIAEHDRAGELLAELRIATGAYSVPPDGCTSYRSLYDRLAALEEDTHLHIHKENHVLFPRALAR